VLNTVAVSSYSRTTSPRSRTGERTQTRSRHHQRR